MFEQILWLVPVAVVATGIWRPTAGLLAFAACLPLFGSPPGGPYLAPLEIAALAGVVVTFRRRAKDRSSLEWPVAAFVLVSAASLLPIAYSPPSWHPAILLSLLKSFPSVPTWTVLYTWRSLANILIGWALFYAVRRVFDRRSVETLGVALGGGLGFVLILGLMEHAGLVDFGAYRSIGGVLSETRLHSLFFHSGWLAEYIVVATPFCAAALSVGKQNARTGGTVLVVLAMVTLLFTQQRGAWFAALSQILVLAVLMGPRSLRDRKPIRQTLLVLASVVLFGLLIISVKPDVAAPLLRRFSEATSHLSGRTHLWSASAQLFTERPLSGWGLGAFAPAYDLLHPRGSAGAWLYRDTAHSLYFNVAVERGSLGLAALALLGLVVMMGLYRIVEEGGPRERTITLGLLLGVVGFAVNGLVQDMLYLKNIEWLSWILLGVASLYSPPRKEWMRRSAQIVAAVALLIVPWRAFWVAPLPGPGNRSFGFHEVEKSNGGNMQWTTSHAVRREPWQNEVLSITLANGHPKPSEHPVVVTVRIDGHDASARTLRGGWEEIRLELGPPKRDALVLELEVRPTFRPYSEFRKYPDLESSNDFRSLGVAVSEIRWEGQARGLGPDGLP